MTKEELESLLRDKIPALPKKARKVAEYLLSNMREAAFRSIGEVADELNVSKAQLVRVSRILGFKGYADLKSALQKVILEQIDPVTMLVKAKERGEGLAPSILEAEHANLDSTWRMADKEKIDAFVELVKEANNIYCMGWGISSLVAETFYMRFRVMGLPGHMIKRGSLAMMEQVRGVKQGDMVIVCELPSYVVEVTEAVTKCASQKAKIMTITDTAAAPVCSVATLQFYVSALSPTFGSSIIGPLFLAHLLTSILSVELGEAARSALEEQLKFLHDERIFHPVFGLRY
ncbi:MAG TPA: MurR/RpiR family transcriptional regulator [Acetomicrobium sp.]|uniref:MurR/RpiR family transcriptional regulator n=1 Tax=Acetomicrobium mobile TaxID=97477 RepID=UPI0016B6FB5F|nr:MurR/RpiR family transcriptional regulator [Acetomicrobium mobile]NLI42779.1 MurR/RpiR family transcriptional regulator [Synergistaceae bacterium]HXK99538.1 MurR/RpiR family transcriptional regulator [Acetomicrobium sp.]